MQLRKKKIIKILVLLIALILIGFLLLLSTLPSIIEINKFQPESTVYNLDGFEWSNKDLAPVRKYVPLNQISPELKSAVIISEDDTFFKHSGINLNELKRAFQENLKKGYFARGASTITMQLVRNAFLIKKKTIIRKIKEILLAKRVEKIWSKQKIFEYYLNIVEWGQNIYGAEAAAWYYFDKPASQLNLAESALLAGILPNPIRLNPFENWPATKKRQARVLRLMTNSGLITLDEYYHLLNMQINIRGQKPLLVNDENVPEISIFEKTLKDPRIPDQCKRKADSTGILYFPEEQQ